MRNRYDAILNTFFDTNQNNNAFLKKDEDEFIIRLY